VGRQRPEAASCSGADPEAGQEAGQGAGQEADPEAGQGAGP